MNDFTLLNETRHMLEWLADDPFSEIHSSIENGLRKQVPDSRLTALQVTSAPQWLTGARPSKEDPNHAILVRCGVAFEFAMSVETQEQTHELTGVYTWVGVHLDQPEHRRQQVWMDLNGTLAEFGSEGELRSRVYIE